MKDIKTIRRAVAAVCLGRCRGAWRQSPALAYRHYDTPAARSIIIEKWREAVVRMLNQKAGRNDPCPDQSGLKYKKCCGRSR